MRNYISKLAYKAIYYYSLIDYKDLYNLLNIFFNNFYTNFSVSNKKVYTINYIIARAYK